MSASTSTARSSAGSAASGELPSSAPVGTVQEVLVALSDPVRLEMVRRLSAAQAPVACSLLYDGIGKSTASHHFKILREAGLTERVMVGGQTHQQLRTSEVEAELPGVLGAIVAAAQDGSSAAAPT